MSLSPCFLNNFSAGVLYSEMELNQVKYDQVELKPIVPCHSKKMWRIPKNAEREEDMHSLCGTGKAVHDKAVDF